MRLIFHVVLNNTTLSEAFSHPYLVQDVKWLFSQVLYSGNVWGHFLCGSSEIIELNLQIKGSSKLYPSSEIWNLPLSRNGLFWHFITLNTCQISHHKVCWQRVIWFHCWKTCILKIQIFSISFCRVILKSKQCANENI